MPKTKTQPAKKVKVDYMCEVCGTEFKASKPAKTCSGKCRVKAVEMRRRALVLAPLGIEIADGTSDRGLPMIVYKVPVESWPAIEAAAAIEGISADAYLNGWTTFARQRLMRKVQADQKAAMLDD